MPLLIHILHYTTVFLLLIPDILAQNKGVIVSLNASGYGTVYGVEAQVGGQTFQVLVDTGSADLWVLEDGFKCYSGATIGNASSLPKGTCNFSDKTYKETSTFQLISSALFAEHYGSGDAVGLVGSEEVEIGSLQISKQEMALVNAVTKPPEDFSEISGIMGLSFPILGQVHPSNFTPTTAQSFLTDRIKYPTVLTRLQDMGRTYFTLAMQRIPVNHLSGPGGYLSFDTLPPVPHGSFVTVPAERVKGEPSYFTDGTNELSYWVTTVSSVVWEGKNNSQPFQVVVDSGNWINFLPKDLSTKLNRDFNPPGTLTNYFGLGVYLVNCTASPPTGFGIEIGGTVFNIHSADMIWRDVNGTCFSSVAPTSGSGINVSILGDAFLKNVVAVFDYSQHEMKFAQQLANSSSASVAQTSEGTSIKLTFPSLLWLLLLCLVAWK